MRTPILASLLVALAAGCLDKPAVPLEAGDGGTDAPGDGGTDPVCGTRIRIPDDFRIRNQVMVGDILDADATADRGPDDFALIGRVEDGTGEGFVYLVAGRADLDLRCADRRYGFSQRDNIEPGAVLVLEVTGDSNPDLVYSGRVDDAGSGLGHEVHLVPGVEQGSTSNPATDPTLWSTRPLTTPSRDCRWGNTLNDQYPVYLSAWTQNGDPFSHIIYGELGCDGPFAIALTPTSQLGTARRMRNAAGGLLTDPDNGEPEADDGVQRIVHFPDPLGGTNPDYLAIFTNNAAILSRYATTPDFDTQRYDYLHAERLNANADRDVRFRHELGPAEALFGVTIDITPTTGAYEIVRIAHGPPNPFLFNSIATDIGGYTRDYAHELAHLDADGRYELVVLFQVGSDATLRAITNLDISASGEDPITPGQTRDLGVGAVRTLAVGDFLGRGTEQVLTFASRPGADSGAACYHLLPGCLAPCAQTTCP